MIAFRCPTCQKAFNVPDTYAGKQARCKACNNELTVPSIAAPAAPAAMPSGYSKPPLRVRRLIADAELMKRTFAHHPFIRIESTEGSPPEKYRVEITVKSLVRGKKGKPEEREKHLAEVQLGADYPRMPPTCKMLTPVFHPNIDESHICIGDHWTAGERLVDLVTRIAEMLAFQAYNIRSPLNGEAAMWADLNAHKLPTDPRPMQVA